MIFFHLLFSSKLKHDTKLPNKSQRTDILNDNPFNTSKFPFFASKIGFTPLNRWSAGYIQNSDENSVIKDEYIQNYRKLNEKNLNGQNQIITLVDTGIDMNSPYFKDDKNEPPFNYTNFNHRKVIRYDVLGDNKDRTGGHGTHVAGIISGDALSYPYSIYNGIAPKSKLYFIDIGRKQYIDDADTDYDINQIIKDMKRVGSRIFSCSWGYPIYSTDIRAMYDYIAEKNPDILFIFACGNTGNKFSVFQPSGSKNVLSVGGTTHPLSGQIENVMHRRVYFNFSDGTSKLVTQTTWSPDFFAIHRFEKQEYFSNFTLSDNISTMQQEKGNKSFLYIKRDNETCSFIENLKGNETLAILVQSDQRFRCEKSKIPVFWTNQNLTTHQKLLTNQNLTTSQILSTNENITTNQNLTAVQNISMNQNLSTDQNLIAVQNITTNQNLTTHQIFLTNQNLTTSHDLTSIQNISIYPNLSTDQYSTAHQQISTDQNKNIKTNPNLTTYQSLATEFVTFSITYLPIDSISYSDYSSKGPSDVGILKPDLVAPSNYIISANANSENIVAFRTGTSMAAPLIAGSAALIAQYFEEGFYPTTINGTGFSFTPTACLLKCALIHSCHSLPKYKNQIPDLSIGFGIPKLDSIILINESNTTYRVIDNFTVEKNAHYLCKMKIQRLNEDIRCTLVYLDPALDEESKIPLAADIDLVIESPSHKYYYGNNKEETHSTIEQVTIPSNETEEGIYKIHVFGNNMLFAKKIQAAVIFSGGINHNYPTFLQFSKEDYKQRCIKGFTGILCQNRMIQLKNNNTEFLNLTAGTWNYLYFPLPNILNESEIEINISKTEAENQILALDIGYRQMFKYGGHRILYNHVENQTSNIIIRKYSIPQYKQCENLIIGLYLIGYSNCQLNITINSNPIESSSFIYAFAAIIIISLSFILCLVIKPSKDPANATDLSPLMEDSQNTQL